MNVGRNYYACAQTDKLCCWKTLIFLGLSCVCIDILGRIDPSFSRQRDIDKHSVSKNEIHHQICHVNNSKNAKFR